MVFLTATGYAYAQSTVGGTVTDAEDGSAIPGVNVLVKGTSTGTFGLLKKIGKLSELIAYVR